MDSMKRMLRTLQIIWMAFLVVPLPLGVALFTAAPDGADSDPMVPFVICFVALMQIPVMLFMRFQQMGTLALIAPDDLRAEGRVEGEDLDEAVRAAAAKYNTGAIVSFAFAESILMFGFVSSFISGNLLFFGALTVLGVATLLVVRPSESGILCLLTPEQRAGYRTQS